jgi:hypothetical protein
MTGEKKKDVEPTSKIEVSVQRKTEDNAESRSLMERLLSTKKWLRFVFMVLFFIIICVLSYLVGILVLLQFIFALVTGSDNEKLRHLGSSFSLYIAQILQFLTYNSEGKPFPFADWPDAEKIEKVNDLPK